MLAPVGFLGLVEVWRGEIHFAGDAGIVAGNRGAGVQAV